MKITVIPAAGGRQSLAEFADKHGLEMVVRERRDPPHPGARWFAQFNRSEVKGSGLLSGAFGNGASPLDAIRAYAHRISGELLVIDAYTADRREIQVPELYFDPCTYKE